MRIFISWSGKKSRDFAEALKPWLEQVLPTADVRLSTDDIDKGTIWFSEIIGELEECNCGIVCITRDNHLAPWIHFEASGMITGLGKTRIATLLLDIGFGEIQQPLSQFNGLPPDREGMHHLVKTFNKLSDQSTGHQPIKDHVLERTFDKFWGEMEAVVRRLFPPVETAPNPEPPLPLSPRPVSIDEMKSRIQPKPKRSKKTSSADQTQMFSNGEK
jgi:hypothetical protein